MNTKAHDPPPGIDAMHAEGPERKRPDYIEEAGLFYRRHDFRLEQQTVWGAFQWKKFLLMARGPGHTDWIHWQWQGMRLNEIVVFRGHGLSATPLGRPCYNRSHDSDHNWR